MPEATPPLPQRFSHYPGLPVPFGLPVVETPAGPCPYLPGRTQVTRGFACEEAPGEAYQALLDAGFRRSGVVFYQCVCPGCRACVPIRVPVARFVPSKSQRRCWRRNADLRWEVGEPAASEEKFELYVRYLEGRHDAAMGRKREGFEGFLYQRVTPGVEVTYRDGAGRLVGVGLCDVTPTAVSSVYFYFEPAPQERRRGLGTFSSLVEIEVARKVGLAYYYLGFWIRGCGKMEYKDRFRPCEFLGTDGVWRNAEV